MPLNEDRHIARVTRSAAVLALALAAGSCDRATGPRAGGDTPIMFQSSRADGYGLYLMSTDGRTVVSRVALGGGGARPGDWSPDGRQIAFTATSPQFSAHVANVDGTGERALRASAGPSLDPRWSPTGRTIIYFNNDVSTDWGVNALNLDGSNDHRLPSTAKNWGAYDWSPDGTHIVFGKLETAQINGAYVDVSSLFITDSAGVQLTRLTRDTTCYDADPAWSPDGSTIAYDSCGEDGKNHIYVINAAGGAPKAITTGTDGDYDPTWSPDGRQIAFQRGANSSADVWLMQADGTGATNLTANNPGFDGRRRSPAVPR